MQDPVLEDTPGALVERQPAESTMPEDGVTDTEAVTARSRNGTCELLDFEWSVV